MSNNVSDEVRRLVEQTATRGTQLKWIWPLLETEPEGSQITAFLVVYDTSPDGEGEVVADWYVQERHQEDRPPGVFGDYIPYQVLYDAIAAGKLVSVTTDMIRMPKDNGYEIVRKVIVASLDANRQYATVRKILVACGERFTMEMLTNALCAMKAQGIVGWGGKDISSDTSIQFLRPLSLRNISRR
jgi:hypothetical protein